MQEYRTKWATQPPPYGAFEDYVIFEIKETAALVMHQGEFDWLARALHSLHFESGQGKYIQMVKEWSECIGFCGNEEKSSVIRDVDDTVEVLSLVKAEHGEEWGHLGKKDLEYLKAFLRQHRSATISIRRK